MNACDHRGTDRTVFKHTDKLSTSLCDELIFFPLLLFLIKFWPFVIRTIFFNHIREVYKTVTPRNSVVKVTTK